MTQTTDGWMVICPGVFREGKEGDSQRGRETCRVREETDREIQRYRGREKDSEKEI